MSISHHECANTNKRLLCSSAVHAAYIQSLESQISSLRDEIAAVYKTQGQNAQRLLSMNETLREKEELARVDADSLRHARDELAVLRRKVEQHDELMAEKDRGIQVIGLLDALKHGLTGPSQLLHDEVHTLNLELNQVSARNDILKVDNASLLQRWLDHMNEVASKMNSANMFYEDMQTKGWKDADPGGGPTNGEDPFVNLEDSLTAGNANHLNPNG